LEVLNKYQRKKLDESNDEEFYSDPKFVYHLDANFRQNLSDLYEREIDNYSTVLDLMSSWDSYLPKGKKYKKVIGHGLNKKELEKNKILEKSGYDEVMHTDSYTGDMQGMNASSSDMGSIKENIEIKMNR